jgi:hypothetical protein
MKKIYIMKQLWWPLLIMLSTIAAYFVIFQDPINSARPEIILWFLCICPGAAIVRCFHFMEPFICWMLTFALSLALDAGIASILLYAHAWSPTRILKLLFLLCLCGVYVQLSLFCKTLIKQLRQASIP